MRSRGIALALVLSLLSAGAAVGCFLKSRALEHDAAWIMARGNAEADEYVASFNGASADRELASFGERREVLERADGWDRGERGLILASALFALLAYGLFLRRRLHEQLADSDPSFAAGGLPLAARAMTPPHAGEAPDPT